ncbi:BTB/POZ domain-containing protein KCTD6-like [Patiria miniata]|uniref:BTB domain-containing protein n=1 Tax=Patiria miniata TaxID=46514 RepID=A0A913ZH23_PATMI|nr:BTB/POZ domain-containing protein KCTD6-like [Patiria miniata]XP_038051087.1 BTB/POZ domain-containing protein KCTD6-like [Patiria miniata]
MDDIVHLNVGGVRYTTMRSTLTRYPKSMLFSMFSGPWKPAAQDADGTYVIDRDGPLFRIVLNFLRQGKLCLGDGFKEWSQMKCEANFYQIQELMDAVVASETLQTETAKKEREEEDELYDKRYDKPAPETEFVVITAKVNNYTKIGKMKYSGSREVLEKMPQLMSFLVPFVSPEDMDEHEAEMFGELERCGEIEAERNYELNRERPVHPMDIFQEVTAQGFEVCGYWPCPINPDCERWIFSRPVKRT